MNIKLKLMPEGVAPKKATLRAAAYDAFAAEIIHKPFSNEAIIKLGFSTEIPAGYKGVVVPRSSITKTYWAMQNSPGQIDSDYRGEWQIRLKAIPKRTLLRRQIGKPTSSEVLQVNEPLPFKVGDRVCQIFFEKVLDVTFTEVDNLSETERQEGGFGSTGN